MSSLRIGPAFLGQYVESFPASQGMRFSILSQPEQCGCESVGFLSFSVGVNVVSPIAIFKAKCTEQFMGLLWMI